MEKRISARWKFYHHFFEVPKKKIE